MVVVVVLSSLSVSMWMFWVLGQNLRRQQRKIHEGLYGRLITGRIDEGAVLSHHAAAPRQGVHIVGINQCPDRGPDEPVVDKIQLLVEHITNIAGRPASALIVNVEILKSCLRYSVQDGGYTWGPNSGYCEALALVYGCLGCLLYGRRIRGLDGRWLCWWRGCLCGLISGG